jgi:hypothetical protein
VTMTPAFCRETLVEGELCWCFGGGADSCGGGGNCDSGDGMLHANVTWNRVQEVVRPHSCLDSRGQAHQSCREAERLSNRIEEFFRHAGWQNYFSDAFGRQV